MTTEKSIRRLTVEEQMVDRRNLAVPSPIFRDTDPISSTMIVSEGERERRAQVKVTL